MRIGILSDSHGLLRPEIFEVLERVDHLVHAGDVGPAPLLAELTALAPLTAVWGNTDGFDLRHRLPERAQVELEGLRFAVVHGHTWGLPSPELLDPEFPDADVIVFGHTHRPLVERRGDRWFVNPGSCGPKRAGHPVSLVLARVAAGRFEAEFVELEGNSPPPRFRA